MKYKMYDEIMEQKDALVKTFESEASLLDNISSIVEKKDKVYLVGCGSSISTCYSVRDALASCSTIDVDVFTGFEFTYNKKLILDENSIVICTSQSGETGDTVAALRKAQKFNIPAVSISNEPDSTMTKEADYGVVSRGGRETAILGTKTYVTQLACLYYILFKASDYENKDKLLDELKNIGSLLDNLLKSTHDESKKLAELFKDEEIFYCLGSGPNFGLSYKLAMTMFMEGALKHACPLYSAEFRHGLIERAEKGVPAVFLNSGFESDVITDKAIDFCEKLEMNLIIYNLSDYVDDDFDKLLSPFVFIAPLEWFIYYLAHFNNEDPGSTRHIGKVRYD